MQQRENLSAYMDGHNVNGEFTDTLCNSPELQQKWASYHAIRSVMRGEELMLGSDFSAKMEALLENEVMEKTSAAEPKKGLMLKLKRWSTPIMQAGIAASVCLVAVLGVNMMNSGDEVAQVEQPALQTVPLANSSQAVSFNSPAAEQPTAEQLENQQQRINTLLQNYELQRRTAIGLTPEQKQQSQTSATEKSAQPQH